LAGGMTWGRAVASHIPGFPVKFFNANKLHRKSGVWGTVRSAAS
jgi:hypothetical protein